MSSARGEAFADFEPSRAVWAQNSPSAKEMQPLEHIIGPRMPRISPVSPSHVSPCGAILYSDGLTKRRGAEANSDRCGFCERWLEQLSRE